jgi:transcriptional regulator with XRE-family HTH domain
MAKTKDFAEVIEHELQDDAALSDAIETEILNARIAMEIYRIRTEAKLTQKELAELIGTKQPVIARLEDANYRGRSLTLLQKIATATGCRIKLTMEKKDQVRGSEIGEFGAFAANWYVKTEVKFTINNTRVTGKKAWPVAG